MKNTFKPHGFIPIDPDRPGFARAIFKSCVESGFYFQAISDEEAVSYEKLQIDAQSIFEFTAEKLGDLTKSWSTQVLEASKTQKPLYVFSWGNGEVTVGTKEEVATALVKKLETLIALPHIYASVGDFIYSTPSMRGTNISRFRETDSQLLFESDQNVALLQAREKELVSRLSAEGRGKSGIGDTEVTALIEVRRAEGCPRIIADLASSYLKLERKDEALKLLLRPHGGLEPPASHPAWLTELNEIEAMLSFADRELDRGKNRLAKLTYSKALGRMGQRYASDAWYRIARLSISRRLERLEAERGIVSSFEWMLLDCLVKELTSVANDKYSGFDNARRTLLLLGELYTSSGLLREAQDTFALASDASTASSLTNAAALKKFSSKLLIGKASLEEQTGNFESAEAYYEEAVSNVREGGEDVETLSELASMLVRLSKFYLARGRFVATEATANECLAIRRLFALAGIPGGKENLLEIKSLLERLYIDAGRNFELSLLRKSLDIPIRRSR